MAHHRIIGAMGSLTRRAFLQTTSGVLAGVPAMASLRASALDMPLGFMLHALRAEAAKDLPGTLRRVAALGVYSEIELVSFKGYSAATARDGFGPLAPMPTSEIAAILRDVGFRTRSCHFKYQEFDEGTIDQTLEWARGVGTEYVTIGDVAPAATLDDWKRHFDRFSAIGTRVRSAGMKLGLHTQNDIWRGAESGSAPIDALFAAVDAQHCQVQLDLSTAQSMKVDPAAFLSRYPGRFFAIHLRDARTPQGTGYLPSVPLGQGDVNWRALFAAAAAAKVPHYIVEMQTQGQMDPVEALRISASFIRDFRLGA